MVQFGIMFTKKYDPLSDMRIINDHCMWEFAAQQKGFDDTSPAVERSENPLKKEQPDSSLGQNDWHSMWYEAAGAKSKVLLEDRATNAV